MQWVRNFFFWLFVKNTNKNRKTAKPIAIKEAKTIGILFEATNFASNEKILEFVHRLKSYRKQVELIGYIPKREFGDKLLFEYFTNKNVSWLGKPNLPEIERFSKTKFDLLLNFQTHAKLPLEYIAVKTPAVFKVSFCPDIDIANYDLILISKENSDISNSIRNLENYLQ